jgi:Ca-activated chloride channel family protein
MVCEDKQTEAGMLKKISISLFVSFLILSAQASIVFADGIIIPDPHPCRDKLCPPYRLEEQLVIRYHHVNVSIEGQLSRTTIDQVFYNPNDFAIEGQYIFPIPLDAAVGAFKLWMDGKPVEGKILDAGKARDTYEDIVRQIKDPALLEYIGAGAVQANIFPIPPWGEARVQLEYSQVLIEENGLIRYTYPLNTEKFSSKPLESVSIHVDINEDEPIQGVYSPTHDISVERDNNRRITASYEANDIKPDKDFILYINPDDSSSFHLFTYKDPGDKDNADGFFLALLSPPPVEKSEPIPKDVLLVIDRSGSMDGDKFDQAREAAGFILDHLNPKDRFYISSFSSNIKSFSPVLSPSSSIPDARHWLNTLSAAGSTDINRALQEAVSVTGGSRPAFLIFITDGLPTEGVIDRQDILDNFDKASSANLRVFTFGVGYDVDTFLLDILSQEHHGTSTYVKPEEPLGEVLSNFYTRISDPILANIRLDFGSMDTYDMYPNPMPDLFPGSQVIITGRYKAGGAADIRISGDTADTKKELVYPGQEFSTDSRELKNTLSDIPRLWATRKIGYLLNRIRLDGPKKETIDQVVKLSIRYGIVTPYTSFLVSESNPIGKSNQDEISRNTYEQMQAMPPQAVSGQGAVQKSSQQGGYENADSPVDIPKENNRQIRVVGAKTFIQREGVWIDTASSESKLQVTKVEFLSDNYFKLAAGDSLIRQAFALGNRVIVQVGADTYEVVDHSQQTPAIQPTQPGSAPEPAMNYTPTVHGEDTSTSPPDRLRSPSPTSTPPLPTDSRGQVILLAAGILFSVCVFGVFLWRKIG